VKIVSLTAENIKRLKAVEIRPDGPIQVVAGRNAQGKSSVLDSIWLALGGGAAQKATKKTIRDGEEGAFVRLDLGDLIVTRTWHSDTSSALVVESQDGARYGSPQGMLDALVGKLAFDPLAFIAQKEKEQVQTLLSLVSLPFDPAELDAKRLGKYEQRTTLGQHLKTAKGSLASQEKPEAGVPDEEVSSAAILAEMEAAQAVVRASEKVREAAADALRAFNVAADREHEAMMRADAAKTVRLEAEDAVRAANKALDTIPDDPDLSGFAERLASVEATNRTIRAAWQYKADSERVTALADEYDDFTAAIEAIDDRKAAGLASAKFPIDGLGFDGGGVTYKGIPFSQASGAEQLRVSLAMAMAMNPDLRVIRITDGSLLDADNMALIAEMATAADYQVWIERVGDADKMGVVIEDGQVVSE